MSLQHPHSTSDDTKYKQRVHCDTDAGLELPAGSLAAPSAAAAAQQLSALYLSTKVVQPQQPLLESFDLNGVADLIKSGRAQRIVVMAGAGISVSAGIPDFRSPGTGLYSQLQRFDLPWPEAVFDLRYFRHNPKPFCMLAKELWPGYHKHAPTPAHHFLRLLHEKGLLLTVFSQNVDGLEQIAGVPADTVVNAHGSFDGAHCIDCKQPCSIYAVQAAVYDDEVPTCSSCGGLVKPDITFFGEALPARFHRRRLADMQQADLLIVMGTSLLVQPFASMIDQVPASTPRVLLNLNRAGERKQEPQPQQQQQQQQQECTTPEPAQQQQQRWQPCGPLCRLARHKGTNHSSDEDACDLACSSSSDSDTGSSSDSDDEAGSNRGSFSRCDSFSPALTACNSVAGLDSCCCSPADGAAADQDSSDSTEAEPAEPSVPAAGAGSTAAAGSGSEEGPSTEDSSAGDSGSSNGSSTDSAGGFDFDACVRDVLHLGTCDSAVQQLAGLLGWQGELQQLMEAGDAAFRGAQSCWED